MSLELRAAIAHSISRATTWETAGGKFVGKCQIDNLLRWDFDDGDNRRCCYASPGQPELCSGKNQSEGCKQGSDLVTHSFEN